MKLPLPKQLPMMLLALVAVASLSGNVWLYRAYSNARQQVSATPELENAALLAKVRQLMSLPDEVPTIATVTDPSKLQNQAFFAHAKTGDKVLIFREAKKAVLYNPGENRIIEVAPLSDATTPPAPEVPPVVTPKPTTKTVK
jgi:hypothetical protein